MSNAKRYTIVSSDGHASGFAIKERDDGIYCLHSAYAALKAERDALRERCETLGHELGMSKRNEARWIEKGEEAISERNAANKALEAIKRHQEIVAGTGTAQMSTTWKIANDYLRSRGAALSATEVPHA